MTHSILMYSVNGTMHVSYAYIHRPQDSLQTPPDVFHTRQLSYPVMVTVYHMLECHGMDIIPFPPSVSSHSDDVDSAPHGRMSSLRVGGDGWCLFSIDVRNTYGLPFEVTFERVQEGRCIVLVTLRLFMDFIISQILLRAAHPPQSHLDLPLGQFAYIAV